MWTGGGEERDGGREMGEGLKVKGSERQGWGQRDGGQGERGQRDRHKAKATHKTNGRREESRKLEERKLSSKTFFHSPQGPQPDHSLFPRRPISTPKALVAPKCPRFLPGPVCPSVQTVSPHLSTLVSPGAQRSK